MLIGLRIGSSYLASSYGDFSQTDVLEESTASRLVAGGAWQASFATEGTHTEGTHTEGTHELHLHHHPYSKAVSTGLELSNNTACVTAERFNQVDHVVSKMLYLPLPRISMLDSQYEYQVNAIHRSPEHKLGTKVVAALM